MDGFSPEARDLVVLTPKVAGFVPPNRGVNFRFLHGEETRVEESSRWVWVAKSELPRVRFEPWSKQMANSTWVVDEVGALFAEARDLVSDVEAPRSHP